MKGSFLKKTVIVLLVFFGIGALLKMSGSFFGEAEKKVSSNNTILHLDLNGPILNGKKFLKNIKKYREERKVKALLVVIDSPGGAVGPSQEIFAELKRVREEFKKPVICVSTGIMASGAYYSAVACDKIIVAPGSLVGSIGVIMQFANLEKLYDWAKISRYSITSGRFKDSGAEYRPMREDEKALFQSMIDEVYSQFKETVMKERNLSEEIVKEYADGRVFTGASAVKLGFADQVGYYEDAVQMAAEIAQLGRDYEVFEIPKKKMSIFDLGGDDGDDDVNSLVEYADLLKKQGIKSAGVQEALKFLMRTEYLNQPLYLMPGVWE